MGKFKDLKGNRYGRLTVLELDHIKRNDYGSKTYWRCVCDCGNEVIVRSDSLGRTTFSCGCITKENIKKLIDTESSKENRFKSTHGDSKTRFYKIFEGMKARCNRPSHSMYRNYGGKGIRVEWSSYEDFKKDMYDSYIEHCNEFSEKETTIDRIDSNGNYSKDNCKWSTHKEQSSNISTNVLVIMDDGSLKTLREISDITNITVSALRKRYYKSKYKGTKRIPYNQLIKNKDIV